MLSPSLILVISFLTYVKYSYSIMCYDCNSAYDPRCGVEFDPFSLGVVNCSLRDPIEHIDVMESKICRAIKMEIYGKTRVVRTCGYLPDNYPEDQSCRRHSSVGDVFVTYCSCDTDLCNSANVQTTAVVFIVTMLSLLFV